EQLVEAVRWVKRQPVVCDSALVLPPSATAEEALRLVPPVSGHGIVVEGTLGVLPAERLAHVPGGALLGDLIHGEPALIELSELGSGRAAFDAVHAEERRRGVEMFAVVDGGRLVGTISSRSALRGTLYRPAVDTG